MWVKISKEQIKDYPVGTKVRVNGVDEAVITFHWPELDYGFNVDPPVAPWGINIFSNSEWENHTVEVDKKPITIDTTGVSEANIALLEEKVCREFGLKMSSYCLHNDHACMLTVDYFDGDACYFSGWTRTRTSPQWQVVDPKEYLGDDWIEDEEEKEMSNVKHGCYVETAGLDQDTVGKLEEVFTEKFGVCGLGLGRLPYTRLFAGRSHSQGSYYHTETYCDEFPVTVEEVLEEHKKLFGPKFESMSFKVDSEEHFYEIWDYLAGLGYKIYHPSGYTGHSHLNTNEDGDILQSMDAHGRPKMKLEVTKSYKIVPDAPAPREMTIEEVSEALGYDVKIVE